MWNFRSFEAFSSTGDVHVETVLSPLKTPQPNIEYLTLTVPNYEPISTHKQDKIVQIASKRGLRGRQIGLILYLSTKALR